MNFPVFGILHGKGSGFEINVFPGQGSGLIERNLVTSWPVDDFLVQLTSLRHEVKP